MTIHEALRFLEYQARTMAHLHGLAAAKPWMEVQEEVRKLAEEAEILRDNLTYCQEIHAACQNTLREKDR